MRVGFLFALIALCISVVSFPIMLDRHTGAAEAMVTSLRRRGAESGADGGMGIDRGGAAGRGNAAVLLGLAVVIPVLGMPPGISIAR